MAVKETVELKVVVTPELSRLTSLEQKLSQPHNVSIGLNVAKAEQQWGKLKGTLNTAITPQINESQLYSLNNHIDLKLRHWEQLKSTLEKGVRPTIDYSKLDSLPDIKIGAYLDTTSLNAQISRATTQARVRLEVEQSINVQFQKETANVIYQAVKRAFDSQKSSPLKKLLSLTGSVVTAPIKAAGSLATGAATSLGRGFFENIGRGFSDNLRSSARDFTTASTEFTKSVDHFFIGEKARAVFLSEILRSGNVSKAGTAASEVTELADIIKRFGMMGAVASAPASNPLKVLRQTTPEAATLVEDTMKQLRAEGVGRKDLHAQTIKRVMEQLRPQELIDDFLSPIAKDFGGSWGKFIGIMQAYRVRVAAEGKALDRKADMPNVNKEGAPYNSLVQTIGGAQFLEGEGGRSIAARLEAFVDSATKVIAVQNPDTDNSSKKNFMLDTLMSALSPALQGVDESFKNTVANALRQVVSAVDPTYTSDAAVDALANIIGAKSKGTENFAVTGYSLGNSDLIKFKRAADLFGVSVKVLAQAYPYLNLTGEAFEDFTAVINASDPLMFPFDSGFASKPSNLHIVETGTPPGIEAHADKHLYKSKEFLGLMNSILGTGFDLDASTAELAGYMHAVGSSMYEVLGSVEQLDSLLESGDFNTSSQFRGFAAEASGAGVATTVVEKLANAQSALKSQGPKMPPEASLYTEKLIQRLTPSFENLRVALVEAKVKGITEESSPRDIFGALKVIEQASERNKDIDVLLGKITGEDAKDSYFGGKGNTSPESLKSVLVDLAAGVSFFKKGEFGGSTADLKNVWVQLEKAIYEIVETGSLSPESAERLEAAKLPEVQLNNALESIFKKTINPIEALKGEEEHRTFGSDVPDFVKARPRAALAYNAILESMGDSVRAILPPINDFIFSAEGMSGAIALLTDSLVFKTDLHSPDKIASEQEVSAYEKLQGRYSPMLHSQEGGKFMVTERLQGSPVKDIIEAEAEAFREVQEQLSKAKADMQDAVGGDEKARLSGEIKNLETQSSKLKREFNEFIAPLYRNIGELGGTLMKLGVAHNDLASSNVFVTPQGEEYLEQVKQLREASKSYGAPISNLTKTRRELLKKESSPEVESELAAVTAELEKQRAEQKQALSAYRKSLANFDFEGNFAAIDLGNTVTDPTLMQKMGDMTTTIQRAAIDSAYWGLLNIPQQTAAIATGYMGAGKGKQQPRIPGELPTYEGDKKIDTTVAQGNLVAETLGITSKDMEALTQSLAETSTETSITIDTLGTLRETILSTGLVATETIDNFLGAIASGKINRSPLNEEEDVSKKLSELSVRDWATVAKEDIASVLFEIQSIGKEFDSQLEVARPFFRLSFSSWKTLLDLAGELSDTILPAIPGGETTKKLAQNVGVPIAIAGAVSMLSPEAYALLHSAAAGLTEAGLNSAELLLRFQTAIGEAIPALQPFTAVGENALKLAGWLSKIPGAGGLGQGLLEGASVVGTGALATKGVKDTIGAVAPKVIKEEAERASLSPVMRKLYDKQKSLEGAESSVKLTLEQYDEVKPKFTAANREVKSRLNQAEIYIENGMSDLALTLVEKAKEIQLNLHKSINSTAFDVPERRRSVAAFRGNSAAQLNRIGRLEEGLTSQGAKALPPVNLAAKTREDGAALVEGAIEGIESKSQEFVRAFTTLAKEGQGEFRQVNEMQSPSRVYGRYGAMIGAGAADGVVKSIPSVKAAVSKLSKEAQADFAIELPEMKQGEAVFKRRPIRGESAVDVSADSVSPVIDLIKSIVASTSGIDADAFKNLKILSTDLGSVTTKGMFRRNSTKDVHINKPLYVGAKYGVNTATAVGTIAHEIRHAVQLHAETTGQMLKYLTPKADNREYVMSGVKASVGNRTGTDKVQSIKREMDAYSFEADFIKQFGNLVEAFQVRKGESSKEETPLILASLKTIKRAAKGDFKAEDFSKININLLKAFNQVGNASDEFARDLLGLLDVINSYHPDAAQGEALTASAEYQFDASTGGNIGKGAAAGVLEGAADFDAAMVALFEGGKEAFEDAAGIASPAKEMMKPGDFLVRGAILGVNQAKPDFYKTMAGLFDIDVAEAATQLTSEIEAALNLTEGLSGTDLTKALGEIASSADESLAPLREMAEVLAATGDTEALTSLNKALAHTAKVYGKLETKTKRAGGSFKDSLTPLRRDVEGTTTSIRGQRFADSALPTPEAAANLGENVADKMKKGSDELSVLGEKLRALSPVFGQVKEVASAFGGPVLGQMFNSMGGIVERFGILKAGGTGAFLAVALGVGAYTAAQAGLAQELKSLSLQFKALGYDGEASIDRMFRLSQKTGTSFKQTAKLGAGIAGALQFTGIENQTVALTEQIVKVNTALQLGADESQRFETALVQMLSKGVVSMEEVRQQAAEAVPSFFPALARGLDMTPGEAMKAISSGEVSSAEAVPAALEELTKMSEGSYREGLKSLPASLNRISNSMMEINATFGAAPLGTMSAIARTFANILEASTPLIKVLSPLASVFVLVGIFKALKIAVGSSVFKTAFGVLASGLKLFTVEVTKSADAFLLSMTKYVSGVTGLQGVWAGLATGGAIVGLTIITAAVGGLIHHMMNYNKELKEFIKEMEGADISVENEAVLAPFEQSKSSNPISAGSDRIPQGINYADVGIKEARVKLIQKALDSDNAAFRIPILLSFGGEEKARAKLKEFSKELLEVKEKGGAITTFGKNESVDKRFGPEAEKVNAHIDSILTSFGSLDIAKRKAFAVDKGGLETTLANIDAQIALESNKGAPDDDKIKSLQAKAAEARKAISEFENNIIGDLGIDDLEKALALAEGQVKDATKRKDTDGIDFWERRAKEIEKQIKRVNQFTEQNPILIQLAVAEGKFQDSENALLVNLNETRAKFLKDRAAFAITEEQLGLKEAQAEKINANEKIKNLNSYLQERSDILKNSPGAASLADALGVSAGDFESSGFETASLEQLNGLIASIENGAPGAEKYKNTLGAVKELKQGIVDLSGARLDAAEATRREVQANVQYLASLRDVLGVVLKVNAARESMNFALDTSQTQARIGLNEQRLNGEIGGSTYDVENARLSMNQLAEKIQVNTQHMADLNAALVELTAQEKAQAAELIGNDINDASYGELKDFLARQEQSSALGLPVNANISEAAKAKIAQYEVGNENLQLEEQQMEAARAQLVEVTASQLRQYRASIRNFNQSISDYIDQMNDQLEDTNAEIRGLQSQTNLIRRRNELREHLLGATQSIDREFFTLIIDAVSGITDILDTGELRQNARAIRDLTKQNTRTIQSTMDELASINEQRYDMAGVSQPGTVSLGNKLENTGEDRLSMLDDALGNTLDTNGTRLSVGLQGSTDKILNASNNFGGALQSGASVLEASQKAAYDKLKSLGAQDTDNWQSSPGVFMASASKLAEQQGMADLRAEYKTISSSPERSGLDILKAASIYSAFGGDTKAEQDAALEDFKGQVGDFFDQDFAGDGFDKIGNSIEGETSELTGDMNAAFEKTLAALNEKGTAIANLNREKITEILLGAKEGFDSLTRRLPETIMQLKQNLRQLDNSIADFALSGAVVLTPQQRAEQQDRQRIDTFEGINLTIEQTKNSFTEAGALLSGDANAETIAKLNATVEELSKQGVSPQEQALAKESAARLRELVDAFAANGDRVELQTTLQEGLAGLTGKQNELIAANNQALSNNTEARRQERNAQRASIAQTMGGALTDTANTLNISQIDKDYLGAKATYNVALASQAKELDDFRNQLIEAGQYSDELFHSFKNLSDIKLERLKDDVRVIEKTIRETLKSGLDGGLNTALDDLLNEGKLDFGKLGLDLGKSIIKGIAAPGIGVLSTGLSNVLTTGKWKGNKGVNEALTEGRDTLNDFSKGLSPQLMQVKAGVVNIEGKGALDALGDIVNKSEATGTIGEAIDRGVSIKDAFQTPSLFPSTGTSSRLSGLRDSVSYGGSNESFNGIFGNLGTTFNAAGEALSVDVAGFAEKSGAAFSQGAGAIAGSVAAIPGIIQSFQKGDVGGGILGIISTALPLIGAFADGTDGPLDAMMSTERAMSGKSPLLAVVHEGEEILTTKNDDAATFRSLKNAGAWDLIKERTKAYATGGTVSRMNNAGASIFGNRSGGSSPSTSTANTSIHLHNVKDKRDLARSQTQIANKQEMAQRQASKRGMNK